MAKSTPTRGKVSEIRDPDQTSDPNSETATALMEPPEAVTGETPATPFDEAEPLVRKPKPTPKAVTFFDRVAGIPLADWQTRAKIRVYRLAPIINRLAGSENKYITIYREPISEEKIKIDHGSGRYRLYLSYKEAGARNERELDMIEFDILDPKFPPNVPAGDWIEDSRNKEWQWARQPGMPAAPPPPPPPPPTGVGELVNVLKVAGDMRRELREEMRPEAPAAPAAPPAPASNPLTDGLAVAQSLLQMRADNPMVDVMRDELKAMREELKEERAEGRRLQEEIRKGQAVQQTAATPKTLLEQVKELASIRAELKGLFGGGGDSEGAPVRPGKLGWLDFSREVLPEIMNSKILNALADRIGAGPAPLPNINPAQQTNGTAPADETLRFVQLVVTPAMLQHYEREQNGGDFAAWIFDGHPDKLAELQAYGEERIFNLYKQHSPRPDWQTLTERGEPAFAKFIREFCSWKPEPEEEPAPVTSGIIDLDPEPEDKEETGS